MGILHRVRPTKRRVSRYMGCYYAEWKHTKCPHFGCSAVGFIFAAITFSLFFAGHHEEDYTETLCNITAKFANDGREDGNTKKYNIAWNVSYVKMDDKEEIPHAGTIRMENVVGRSKYFVKYSEGDIEPCWYSEKRVRFDVEIPAAIVVLFSMTMIFSYTFAMVGLLVTYVIVWAILLLIKVGCYSLWKLIKRRFSTLKAKIIAQFRVGTVAATATTTAATTAATTTTSASHPSPPTSTTTTAAPVPTAAPAPASHSVAINIGGSDSDSGSNSGTESNSIITMRTDEIAGLGDDDDAESRPPPDPRYVLSISVGVSDGSASSSGSDFGSDSDSDFTSSSDSTSGSDSAST